MSEWKESDFSISEESKDAWKILKHHTEVASDRIYEELPDIIQHAFEEGIAYAREQVAREILNNPRLHGDLIIHNHQLGQVCTGCLMLAQATNDAVIARGEK